MKQKLTAALTLTVTVILTACSSSVPEDISTSDISSNNTEFSAETSYDSLPENLDFGGKKVTLFVDRDLPITEFNAEQTGDIVDDAIYERNIAVQERLNVTFEFIESPGAWAGREEFKGTLRTNIMANNSAYDIIAGYGVSIADLAVEQILYDLQSTEYLDFTQPWWSKSITDNLCINGKLYFVSGDISTNMIGTSFAVLFNKDLTADYNIENLYNLVYEGKWTLDKLFSITESVYQDINQNGIRDSGDIYGLIANNTSFDNLYYSCGMNLAEPDSSKGMIISPDFGSEKMAALVEKLCNAFNHTNGIFWETEDSGEPFLNFANGNSIFLLSGLKVSQQLRDVQFEYGILPTPKWDEMQEEYHSTTSYLGSLYAIPNDAADADMSSAVIEALAVEGYYNVMPAFYETALKVKYSSDDDTARMYDIIRESQTYDFGRVYSSGGLQGIPGMIREMVQNDNSNWMSTYESKINTLNSLLEKLVEQFSE